MRNRIWAGLIVAIILQAGCNQQISQSKLKSAIDHVLLTNPVCKVIQLRKKGLTVSPLAEFFLQRHLIIDTQASLEEVKKNTSPPFRVSTMASMYLKWLGQFNYAFCLPAPRFESIGLISEPMPNPLVGNKLTMDVIYSYRFPPLPDWMKDQSFELLIDDDDFRLSRFIRKDDMPIHSSICMEVTKHGFIPLKDRNNQLRMKCRE